MWKWNRWCVKRLKAKCTEMLGNKLFLKCKTSNFSKRFFFFSFQLSQDFMQKSYRIFTQICELLVLWTVLKKLMQKDFFPSYWRNNKIFKPRRQWKKKEIFFIYCKIKQLEKMMIRWKPREWKENSGLKCRSQIESEHENAKKKSKQHRF